MDLVTPTGPAEVTQLDQFSDVDDALPLLVTDDGEILGFVAIGEFEGAAYAYDPFGGWRTINEESLEKEANLETRWIQVTSDGFTEPVPAGMRAIEDVEEARRVKEDLLEKFHGA